MDALSGYFTDLQNFGPYVYAFILFLSFAESFVVTGMFVPGTTLVVIAGGFASHGVYSYWLLVLFATIGAVIGDGISYEMGRRGQMRIQRGSLLKKHIERAKPYFQKHRKKSILVGRFLGPLRPVIPFLAGVAGMKRSHFYAANIPSGIAWSIFYVGIGFVFGTAWKLALLWSSRLLIFLIIAFIVLFLIGVLWRWIIARGKPFWSAFLKAAKKMSHAFLMQPSMRSWMKAHPRIVRFLKKRFHRQDVTGLPLTGLIVAAVVSIVMFIGIAQDYITGDPITFLDVRLENLLYIFRTPELLSFFYIVTLLGDWRIIFASAAFLTVLFLLAKKRSFVLALWLNLFSSEAFMFGSKLFFHRMRPAGLIPALHEDSFSFPSGHATIAAAFYGFIAYLYIREHTEWKHRVSAFFCAFLLVSGIDISRLYLGVHFFSDVLAGNFVGLTTLFFSISMCEWMMLHVKEGSVSFTPRWMALGFLVLSEGIAVLLFLFLFPIHWTVGTPVRSEQAVTAKNVLPLFTDGSVPVMTETLLGRPQEPISFIVVGSATCLQQAFDRAKWQRVDLLSLDAIMRITKATFFDEEFISSPVSPYFYNSYPQDYSFEKQTFFPDPHGKYHARVWQTNYTTEEGPVFVVSVSLDRRTKWTFQHVINPNVDRARELLLQDLLQAKAIKTYQTIHLLAPQKSKYFLTDGKVEWTQLLCESPVGRQ